MELVAELFPLILVMAFMQHFSIQQIKEWERFYRANFINCLTGFKSVNLIGTVNKNNQPNLAVFSSIVHIGSDPALVGYINRPIAAAPHTLSNIEATGLYTINHIHPQFIAQAHQSSAKYDVTVNEFEATGLTAEFKAGIVPPFVAESQIQYALKLVEIVPITHNKTFLVIGTITDVFVPTEAIHTDGFLNLEVVESVACLGVDAYFKQSLLSRFGYAKADKPIEKIE
jgi:flavin reductase (DIM6/NTAB) family NADH-FMN oxidoreductase RutF